MITMLLWHRTQTINSRIETNQCQTQAENVQTAIRQRVVARFTCYDAPQCVKKVKVACIYHAQNRWLRYGGQGWKGCWNNRGKTRSDEALFHMGSGKNNPELYSKVPCFVYSQLGIFKLADRTLHFDSIDEIARLGQAPHRHSLFLLSRLCTHCSLYGCRGKGSP